MARFLALLLVAFAHLGCGDDGATDAGTGDAAADADGATDGAPMDGDVPVVCDFPAGLVAGTAETDAVADEAARCGLAPYAWSRDATLGDVVAYGEAASFQASLLTALVEGAGFRPPAPLVHDVSFLQYRYVTQDRGALTEATAGVAFPNDLEPGATADVLLYLHGTTGFTDECAPSSIASARLLAALLASYGFVVVAPDFLGLRGFGEASEEVHPYLVGEPTAQAALDAIRAAARMPAERRRGVCVNPRVLVYGTSQGGHGALWVDRLAPYYAREFELLGTVADVPPSDLSAHARRGLTEVGSITDFVVGIYATHAVWYGTEERLNELFVAPWDTDLLPILEGGCEFDVSFDEPTDVFSSAVVDEVVAGRYDDLDPWACFTEENGVGSTSIPRLDAEYPDEYAILFVLGENDDTVSPAIEGAAFDALCADGMPLVYRECAGAGHAEAVVWSLAETLDFVTARAGGVAVDRGELCSRGAPITCAGTP